MKEEIILIIAEQLKNEFNLYEGNIYEVATRIYNIMRLEDPVNEQKGRKPIVGCLYGK